MRHKDRKIESVGDLIGLLKEDKVDEAPTWFRGQGRATWDLVPSIGRNPIHLTAELTSIKRFKQDAWSHISSPPSDEWGWISTMQHYRAKTRLLDWSENPLVALYFALANSDDDSERGALWCLDPVALNSESGHRRAFAMDILAFGDPELESYLPDQVDARKASLDPLAVIGPRNTSRMVAQSGTFTIIHAEPRPIEKVGKKKHIWRYTISPGVKREIRRELQIIGVTEYAIFPELDRVVSIAKGLFS